jgi:hypothetical protein
MLITVLRGGGIAHHVRCACMRCACEMCMHGICEYNVHAYLFMFTVLVQEWAIAFRQNVTLFCGHHAYFVLASAWGHTGFILRTAGLVG